MKINTDFSDRSDMLTKISEVDRSGNLLPPQLVFICKSPSMGKTLFEGIPEKANELLDGEKELFEFTDGEAAAKFPLKTGDDIIQLVNLLGDGNYGTQPLKITGGMAIRLPISDRQILRQAVNSENLFGVGRLLDKEDFWWW